MSRLAAALLAAWLLATTHAAAGPYDPSLRFRTLTTPHFRIHYHRGEEALAARLSAIAEQTHVRLSQAWTVSGNRLTHVVLVDQADTSNGSATVVPWNAIVIYPVPPTGAETIGNTDDWLEYVFVHEYAHVVHLDRSVGWARVARALFGRTEIAFPNLTMPLWQIEGFATLVESERDGGRLHAGDFRDVVDVAARTGRLEPLDRVNGGLVDWPSGQGWYAYGARFHRFLVERYGVARLGELYTNSAGQLPYLTSLAFRRVYGKTLGQLWSEFRASVEAAVATATPASGALQLTQLGYLVDGPRADADGTLYFTAVDADRFPGIYRLAAGATTPSRVVSRSGGSALDVRAGALLFDQLEIARGAALTSDLYLHDERSGATRRLTRDARLMMAERSPDGERIAAIQVVPGARTLVVLDAARLLDTTAERSAPPVVMRAGDGNVAYANPRWSPDGRLLAVERRVRDSQSTIVLLDATTLDEVGVIAGGALDRLATPAWSPDGASLYYGHAVDDRPFQVRVVGVGPGGCVSATRSVTAIEGGAVAPLVRADGSIVFVGYTTRGHDLFALAAPQPAMAPARCEVPHSTRSERPGQPAEPVELKLSDPYRPSSTLVPRGWLPVVEESEGRWRLGASVIGSDVLQRHVVSAAVTWAVTSGDIPSDLAPRTRPDWNAAYAYQRWQPSLYVAAQDRTSLFQAVTSSGALVPVAQREQTVDAGVWRPFRRIRWTQSVLAAYHVERLTTDVPAATDRLTRAGLRSAWTFTSARRYGHSISQEDGVTLAVTGETLGSAFGSDGRSDAVTTDIRAYLPIGIRHGIAAIRGGFAASRGDTRVQRRFRLGGSGGDPVAGGFGSDAISLLRGFPDEVFVGDRVALVNLEVRVPLLSIQRGWGTWPIFLRTVHAAGFADIGNAWTGPIRWADRKVGYGAEVSADVIAAFGLPLTLTAGVGWGDDGAGVITDARELYFRVGRSF